MSVPVSTLDVNPQEIERMLRSIWSEAVKLDRSEEEEAPRLRTTLSNFIIFRLSQVGLDDLIADLCVQFPSRFFVVSLDEQIDGEKISTGVSSRCVLSHGGRHVCSEEILIRCGQRAIPYVGSLLRSLFVPDVPIIALTLGEPTTSESRDMLSLLGEMGDLFLYDSRSFGNFHFTAEFFLSLRREGNTGVRDLNWYRTARYRSLIAERFDSGVYRELWREISQVKFVSGDSIQDSRSLLLAGWMATVLNWRVSSAAPGVIRCTYEQGQSVEMQFVKADSPGTFELEIKAAGDTFSVDYDYSLSRYETSSKFGGDRKRVERTLTVPRFSLADLVVAPVQSSGVDDYFTRSLAKAIEIAGSLR